MSYLKKIYTLKFIGKVRTLAPHILGRDANRGTHAHIHNYTGRGGGGASRGSRAAAAEIYTNINYEPTLTRDLYHHIATHTYSFSLCTATVKIFLHSKINGIL